MQRRRLAYLCLETPHAGQAAHTHVHEIVRGLRDCGWSVQLFATESGGASSGRSIIWRLVDYVAVQVRLLFRLRSIDAIYVRAHPAALPVAMLARLARKDVFQEVNGKPDDLMVTYPWMRQLSRFLTWTYRWQLRHARHIFAVTDGLVNWVRRFAGHDRVSMIPNAANIDVFKPEGPAGSLTGQYVVFIGGLVSWHGIGTMLDATRRPEWPSDVRLVIAGDGVERAQLLAESKNPRILWLGRLPYEQLPPLLRGAIAALCVIENPAGRSDGGVAPIKLFEAMASGTAVIASDLPFQAELVRNVGAGLIVPVANAAALAEAVAELAHDRDAARAMGRRGAVYAHEHASWLARAKETSRIMIDAMAM